MNRDVAMMIGHGRENVPGTPILRTYLAHCPITWYFPSIPYTCLQVAASPKDLQKSLAAGLPHH
jgi:hypothetical protein